MATTREVGRSIQARGSLRVSTMGIDPRRPRHHGRLHHLRRVISLRLDDDDPDKPNTVTRRRTAPLFRAISLGSKGSESENIECLPNHARRNGKMRRMKTPFFADGASGGDAGSGFQAAAIAEGADGKVAVDGRQRGDCFCEPEISPPPRR
ncbi:Os03g0681101 [Oryza sativa Japonica Group]|uniref:Os03g0681101 protein n=1 Tax=Oryza sativa subsp. japonica TaxID=39947 RepID=A0A0N7KHU1_ORYSJ|nr:Os03g0681101 [Oryza sativa Japonica Group]